MAKHVLVTGGAGYIGSHACKCLAQAGYIPVTFDSLEHGFMESVLYGPFEQGRLQDTKRLGEVFAKYPIEGVLHFAALIEVNESVRDPLKYYENNIAGTIALLQAMDAAQCRKIVFSSSAAVYGIPKDIPVKEEEEKKPINPYGYTKLCVEQILERLAQERGFSSLSLRYFNASGADLDGEIGERKKNPSHLIPRVLKAAINDQEVDVYGSDYPTRDGSCIRDYIHVVDLAEAHLLALQYLDRATGATVLNLGTEQGTTVLELLEETQKIVGKKLKYVVKERREGDPPQLIADAHRAKNELGWHPRYAVAEIVASAYEWQKKLLQEKGV